MKKKRLFVKIPVKEFLSNYRDGDFGAAQEIVQQPFRQWLIENARGSWKIYSMHINRLIMVGDKEIAIKIGFADSHDQVLFKLYFADSVIPCSNSPRHKTTSQPRKIKVLARQRDSFKARISAVPEIKSWRRKGKYFIFENSHQTAMAYTWLPN